LNTVAQGGPEPADEVIIDSPSSHPGSMNHGAADRRQDRLHRRGPDPASNAVKDGGTAEDPAGVTPGRPFSLRVGKKLFGCSDMSGQMIASPTNDFLGMGAAGDRYIGGVPGDSGDR